MQRSPDEPVTFEVAKEIAAREGLKAVLTGDVRPLGAGFVLSARLVGTATGDILWAGRQDVANSEALSAAIDQLSGTLRERVGESLRSIRADQPLDQVTTKSFEALQAYVQADREHNRGDGDAAVALLERAIGYDSVFAMAYRKLGVILLNLGRDQDRQREMIERAFALRDRLSPRERYLTEAQYHVSVSEDEAAAVAAYQEVLDRYPADRIALNNLGLIYRTQGRDADALELYKRSIDAGAAPAVTFNNAIPIEYEIGDPDTARAILAAFRETHPDNPTPRFTLSNFMLAEEQYDSAVALLQEQRDAVRGTPRETGALFQMSNVATVRGRLEEARPMLREAMRQNVERNPAPWQGIRASDVAAGADLFTQADLAMKYAGDPDRAVPLLEQALRLVSPDKLAESGQVTWLGIAEPYAQAGRLPQAREYIRRWETSASDSLRDNPPVEWHQVMSRIALAENRLDEALEHRRQARDARPTCELCEFFEIAEIFDAMGQPDSALVYLEGILNRRVLGIRGGNDLPIIYRRLGEIYEAAGDKTKALEFYGKFVDLWVGADAVLQPKVQEVRDRIARLSGEKG
jgi:tetratricopeptide (TPR) repeat protein